MSGLDGRERYDDITHRKEHEDAEDRPGNDHTTGQKGETPADQVVDPGRAHADEEVEKGAEGRARDPHLERPSAEDTTGNALEYALWCCPLWVIEQKRKCQIQGAGNQAAGQDDPQ